MISVASNFVCHVNKESGLHDMSCSSKCFMLASLVATQTFKVVNLVDDKQPTLIPKCILVQWRNFFDTQRMTRDSTSHVFVLSVYVVTRLAQHNRSLKMSLVSCPSILEHKSRSTERSLNQLQRNHMKNKPNLVNYVILSQKKILLSCVS